MSHTHALSFYRLLYSVMYHFFPDSCHYFRPFSLFLKWSRLYLWFYRVFVFGCCVTTWKRDKSDSLHNESGRSTETAAHSHTQTHIVSLNSIATKSPVLPRFVSLSSSFLATILAIFLHIFTFSLDRLCKRWRGRKRKTYPPHIKYGFHSKKKVLVQLTLTVHLLLLLLRTLVCMLLYFIHIRILQIFLFLSYGIGIFLEQQTSTSK